MIKIATCADCAGTSQVAHPSAGEVHKCFRCNGWGVTKLGSEYQGYKTQATADRALRSGYGVRCKECAGEGMARFPMTQHCYRCHDGQTIESAMPGDSVADVPRALRYETARADAAKGYADAVDVVVIAQNRAGTWNEAHLGLGSIVSCTDYGRTWDALGKAAREGGEDGLTAALDAFKAKIREESLNSFQWIKVIRPDDTLADTVAVVVHRNGYTVQAVGAVDRVKLPETYTDAVLIAPV